MLRSLRLEQLRCSFRAGATPEGWEGAAREAPCQAGLSGEGLSCRAAQNHRYTAGVVPERWDASMQAPQLSFGRRSVQLKARAALWTGVSVCLFPEEITGKWAVKEMIRGVSQLPSLSACSNVPGAEQSGSPRPMPYKDDGSPRTTGFSYSPAFQCFSHGYS